MQEKAAHSLKALAMEKMSLSQPVSVSDIAIVIKSNML